MHRGLWNNRFIASLLWLVACGAFCFPTRSEAQQPASAVLISAESLKAHLENSQCVLLDVRDAKAFEAGHLAKAVRVDSNGWKQATKESLDLEDFWKKELSALGISNSSQVIVYGAPLPEVARMWWLLKYVGCQHVMVLDGGVDAFEKGGGKLSQDTYQPPSGNFAPQFQADRVISATDLLTESVQGKVCQTVDNRTLAEFDGSEKRGARGGHIPGAHHSDWQAYLQADGTFKSREDLAQLFQEAGVNLEKPIATHCQSGGRSSVGALVIEHLTGKPARNYYRSWAEWSANSELPVAQ